VMYRTTIEGSIPLAAPRETAPRAA